MDNISDEFFSLYSFIIRYPALQHTAPDAVEFSQQKKTKLNIFPGKLIKSKLFHIDNAKNVLFNLDNFVVTNPDLGDNKVQ
jgi:hypothetical protein